MQALQAHLNRWLLPYSLVAMAAGLLVGVPQARWVGGHSGLLSSLTTVAVFLIIYPMMVNLKVEALLRAGRNLRGLGLSVLYNFIWAPLIGIGLAAVFLRDPLLALGFLLVMVVPCSSMSIGYTGLAEGDLELATLAVALSFLLAVVAVPAWMAVFASRYHVPVPLSSMLDSILTVLIAPMILGYLSRLGLVRWLGREGFKRLQPLFPSVSLLAMFAIVALIFFSKATTIVDKWQLVLLLLVPNALFVAITLAVVTWLDRRLGLSYEDHMAVVFASTGKNNGTAIAIAATAFSPMVAVPAATMPIFQILLLVSYLKLAGRVRAYFGSGRSASPPAGGGGQPARDPRTLGRHVLR
jgi:ACR3 family arsenite transporter